MVWMFVSTQNPYLEIPNGMVLRGGVWERWLDHEGEALINGINAPKKSPQRI